VIETQGLPDYTDARARAEALTGGPVTDDLIPNRDQGLWLFKPVAPPDADGESLVAVSQDDVWQIGSAPDALELYGADLPLGGGETDISALLDGISATEEVV
jgi:hypothetical protein